MLRLVPFQNKVAETRVEYLGSFWTHVTLPHWRVWMGVRIGAPDDLSDVKTNLKAFKTLQTIHNLSSYRFDFGLK